MGRPAKTDVKNTSVETNVDEVKKENDELKATLEALQAAVAEMQKQMGSNGANTTTELTQTEELNADTDITVTNLCPGSLNLSTQGHGQGTIYHFDVIGEELDIPYGDLRDICKSHKNLAQGVGFYIDNNQAVKKLRLGRYYETALTPDVITNIFSKNADNIISLYQSCSKAQKRTIEDMIVDKKLRKEPIDANILIELGRECGRDFINIENPLDIPLNKEG